MKDASIDAQLAEAKARLEEHLQNMAQEQTSGSQTPENLELNQVFSCFHSRPSAQFEQGSDRKSLLCILSVTSHHPCGCYLASISVLDCSHLQHSGIKYK